MWLKLSHMGLMATILDSADVQNIFVTTEKFYCTELFESKKTGIHTEIRPVVNHIVICETLHGVLMMVTCGTRLLQPWH